MKVERGIRLLYLYSEKFYRVLGERTFDRSFFLQRLIQSIPPRLRNIAVEGSGITVKLKLS